MEASHKDNI